MVVNLFCIFFSFTKSCNFNYSDLLLLINNCVGISHCNHQPCNFRYNVATTILGCTGWFHRFDHSSNDGFEKCFLKIAVPKFSKYIISETTTILVKRTCKGVLVSKRLTIWVTCGKRMQKQLHSSYRNI